MLNCFIKVRRYQKRSGFALKIFSRDVPGLIPGYVCPAIHSKIFHGFVRVSRKYGLGSLRKTLTKGIPPIAPGPTSGQLDLKTYNNNNIQVKQMFVTDHNARLLYRFIPLSILNKLSTLLCQLFMLLIFANIAVS